MNILGVSEHWKCDKCAREFPTKEDATGHLERGPRHDGYHFCGGEAIPAQPWGAVSHDRLTEAADALLAAYDDNGRLPGSPWLAAHMENLRAGLAEVPDQQRGAVSADEADRPLCPTCNGEGRIDFNAGWRGPPGVERHHWHPCPDCDGSGNAL